MHPNSLFRRATLEQNLAFAAGRGFGALVVSALDGPRISHVPFHMAPTGGPVRAHLARGNPMVRQLREGGLPAVLVVSGPDSYISPDWYGIADQVPTWNYVAVHLRGLLRLRPQETLREHLAALSRRFESGLEGKAPWTPEAVPVERMEALLRGIVPVEMSVEKVEGTWKLGQNRPDAARLAAAGELANAAGLGHETAALVALMQAVPDAGLPD